MRTQPPTSSSLDESILDAQARIGLSLRHAMGYICTMPRGI
ncbi:MAG: hypothetical protein ABLT11_03190 [Candidatus Acidiferrum sp.]